MPNYLLVTVMSTDQGNITTNVTVQHPVTRIRVALPQNVDECNVIVRVRAQNSGGMSSATEIPVGKLIIATNPLRFFVPQTIQGGHLHGFVELKVRGCSCLLKACEGALAVSG